MYWLTGETSFEGISNFLWYSTSLFSVENEGSLILLQSAAIFIIIALLFKLAAAPFHMWAPDVYEGSPMIVTAFFAIVPKIATLGLSRSALISEPISSPLKKNAFCLLSSKPNKSLVLTLNNCWRIGCSEVAWTPFRNDFSSW